METRFQIGKDWIGPNEKTYFIADIAANHDGDFNRAKRLIELAKDAGADAAKFQNFQAKHIVSKTGFDKLGGQLAHQKAWKKSVYEVYEDAAINKDWTADLKAHCDKVGIEYLTTPYDEESVDLVDPHLKAYKIGSGDIDFHSLLAYVARKGKPMLVATGASMIEDVVGAVQVIHDANPATPLCVMQCNTNYTGSIENFNYVQLNVLRTFGLLFPKVVLGLSDHTPGHAAVLGAVTLGARVVEKHFTDDNDREGPDHKFSMSPKTWAEMVRATRELERALGGTEKRIEPNEKDSAVVQRRSLYFRKPLARGEKISAEHLEALRPAPADAVKPSHISKVVGLPAARDYAIGDRLNWTDWK